MTLTERVKTTVSTPLYRYQLAGVHWLEHCKGRAIIADEMGLGKSIQALSWIAVHPEIRPVVIICPASLKYVWQNQLREHADLDAQVLSGRDTDRTNLDILIINYDIVKYWRNVLLKRIKPKMVILDEFQYVRNTAIPRSKICRKLSRRCDFFVGLSGTPLLNRPIEFYSILNMVAPEEWSSKVRFGFRYCQPTRPFRGPGFEFKGAANLDELHQKVSRIMIRRLKQDVLHQLPKKQRIIQPVDIDRTEYDKAEYDFLQWLREKKGEEAVDRARKAEAMVKVSTLKRIASEAMLPIVYEWIDNFLESTGQKLIVLSIHRPIQDALKARYKKIALTIDSSDSQGKKQANAERFQDDDKAKLLLGGIIPAGTGWTLTSASTVLFPEVDWVPGVMDQAEDRIHRIGQKADSVFAYYLVPRNTACEDTIALHNEKRKIIAQAVDGKMDVSQFEILDGILSAIRKRHRKEKQNGGCGHDQEELQKAG